MGIKEIVDLFISDTKDLVEHAAAVQQGLCVAYCRNSMEQTQPINIDGVPLEQLPFNMSAASVLEKSKLNSLVVDCGAKRNNLRNSEFSKLLLLIISRKANVIYVTETTRISSRIHAVRMYIELATRFKATVAF